MATLIERFRSFDDATYSIRVGGVIDHTWSERFGGMRVSVIHSGSTSATELFGHLKDQAQLMGVLETLYELGMPILSVECHLAP